jgi:hypothetical protein
METPLKPSLSAFLPLSLIQNPIKLDILLTIKSIINKTLKAHQPLLTPSFPFSFFFFFYFLLFVYVSNPSLYIIYPIIILSLQNKKTRRKCGRKAAVVRGEEKIKGRRCRWLRPLTMVRFVVKKCVWVFTWVRLGCCTTRDSVSHSLTTYVVSWVFRVFEF